MFQRPASVNGRQLSHYELVARGNFPRKELFNDLVESSHTEGGWITMWDVPQEKARFTGGHIIGHVYGYTKIMVCYVQGKAMRITLPPHTSAYNYRPENEHEVVVLRPVFA